MIQKLKDLEEYVRAFDVAMGVFEWTQSFPMDETYSPEIKGKMITNLHKKWKSI